jgi:hypothetical protein
VSFSSEPKQQVAAVQCPHHLAVWQDSNQDRPRNARLARASLPCLLRPGHDGEHRTHGGRSWA